MLANEKESEEEYNNLIANADAQLLEKSFNESIINYKKALKIKPNEPHPTDQIKVAEQGIKDQIEFKMQVSEDSATAKLKIDRTKFDIKYGSASFFDGLKDRAIYDEFDLNVNLKF